MFLGGEALGDVKTLPTSNLAVYRNENHVASFLRHHPLSIYQLI